MIIAGTPKQVIAKLRVLLEQTRPGIFAFWGNDGTVSQPTRRRASGCWERRCSRQCARWRRSST